MTALASRVAGARLFGIVALLLVPILLLSYLRIDGHRAGVANLQKEIAGVVVADAVVRSLLAMSSSGPGGKALRENLKAVSGPAAAIGMDKSIANLSLAYSFSALAPDQQIDMTVETLHEIGARSSLIMDEEPETLFLSLHTIMDMPALVRQFHAFLSDMDKAIQSSGIDQSEFKQLLIVLGNLQGSIEKAADTLEHAKQQSKRPESYDSAEQLIAGVAKNATVTADVIQSATPGTEPLIMQMLAKQNFNPNDKYRQTLDVWSKSSSHLNALLTSRLADLQRQLYFQIGTSLLCVLVGAGAAIWMFASTLKRLDTVEAEKLRADRARDESEMARAEADRINDQVAELNRSLAEKIRLLRDAQDEVVKKGRMEQMGQLTATIAHELRNPLGAVRTSAFLVEKKIRGLGLGVEAQMQRINNGIQRCDNIITQLLDYSRNKPLQCKPGNLDEWISRIVSEEAQKLPQSIMIELSLGLDDTLVPFDESRLQRAIINLMANAVEAMTSGPRREGEAREGRLWISTGRHGDNQVAIRVKDNGPGISPENLSKVREPLFTTKSFGTGLGIPAIEQIAHQHGGRLDIESRPGEGATFDILLPLHPPEGLEAHAA